MILWSRFISKSLCPLYRYDYNNDGKKWLELKSQFIHIKQNLPLTRWNFELIKYRNNMKICAIYCTETNRCCRSSARNSSPRVTFAAISPKTSYISFYLHYLKNNSNVTCWHDMGASVQPPSISGVKALIAS